MGIITICRKWRYSLNPTLLYAKTLPSSTPIPQFSAIPSSNLTDFAVFSTGFHRFYHNFSSLASKSNLSSTYSCGSDSCCSSSFCNVPDFCFLRCSTSFRCYSSSLKTVKRPCLDEVSKQCRFGLSSVEISTIIDLIKSNRSDMESRLNSMSSKLTRFAVVDILRGLNVAKVPARRFFRWVEDAHPEYCSNSDICSLMVDNCGRFGDYAGMLAVLKEFRGSHICLSDNAFGFLPILSETKEDATKAVEGVIDVLDQVGGSCRNSGIHSLLELLCSLNSFDLAKYVMEITEKRLSYYNIVVKHLCVRGQFQEAKNVLEEMWQVKCDPDAKTYNYFISSLCKQDRLDEAVSIVDEMLDRGCPPNPVTFEILIYFSCGSGRSEDAVKFYDQMCSRGFEPRLSTHSAFIRGYFNSQHFEEAYKYLVDRASEDKHFASAIYDMLAGLHVKEGDLLVAYKILVEMIGKGLKPKHSLYVRASKRLNKTGKEHFAKKLNSLYSSLPKEHSQSAG